MINKEMNGSPTATTGISGTDAQLISYIINSKLQSGAFMKEIGIRLAAPSVAYLGFSAFFIKHGKHASEEAMKLAFFFQEIGGNFVLNDIKAYNQATNDPVAALGAAIDLEEQILGKIRSLSMEPHDLAVQAFLGELTKMMAVHLGFKRTLLTRASRVRNDPAGLQQLDDELLKMEKHAKHHKKFHGHHEHYHHHHEHHMKC